MLRMPPNSGTTLRPLRSAVRFTATAAALATVTGVVAVTSRDEAVAVDPVSVAYRLDAQTVSASRTGDLVRATEALPPGDARRQAALAAVARDEAQTAAREQAARKKAAAERRREAEARRRAEVKAAAERKAAQARRVARSAVRSAARDPRGAARAMLGSYGWGSGQFSCLDALWTKESGWNVHADNPSSSAYGIPQALPGSKMASAGSDWATNPVTQIRWGLGYIRSTYGSPCSAWAHSRAHNWY